MAEAHLEALEKVGNAHRDELEKLESDVGEHLALAHDEALEKLASQHAEDMANAETAAKEIHGIKLGAWSRRIHNTSTTSISSA